VNIVFRKNKDPIKGILLGLITMDIIGKADAEVAAAKGVRDIVYGAVHLTLQHIDQLKVFVKVIIPYFFSIEKGVVTIIGVGVVLLMYNHMTVPEKDKIFL